VEPWVSPLQHSLGLHDPGGSLMFAAEAGYRLEATMRRRELDVEGVVRLLDDLEAWGCHAVKYGMPG